ncbi:MAG: hypothetical protein R8G66_02575 [Cytophagales bacterium]|nr:hypothetical protein [Cytophagales bacterium]
MMSPQITPTLRLYMVLVLLMVVPAAYAQHFPHVQSILDHPDGEFSIKLNTYSGSLASIAEAIQPKKNKMKMQGDEASLDMSFRVFQRAAVGNRPFAKIRYKIHLRDNGSSITCTFSEFNFKKYERSARYGRMIEEKGNGVAISSAEANLNEVQWGMVRWKMDQEVAKYMNRMLAFESQLDHADTTQQDK